MLFDGHIETTFRKILMFLGLDMAENIAYSNIGAPLEQIVR
jgi:hypothetical protein